MYAAYLCLVLHAHLPYVCHLMITLLRKMALRSRN